MTQAADHVIQHMLPVQVYCSDVKPSLWSDLKRHIAWTWVSGPVILKESTDDGEQWLAWLVVVMGGKEEAGIFVLKGWQIHKGMRKVILLKADNIELHSMKSIKAFLELSPGQVLRADGAEN